MTELRKSCAGQVAGVARDLESCTGHLAALTELRGTRTGQLAGLTRGCETCGGRVAGLAGDLGRCKGQVAGVAPKLDAPDLPLAGLTALRRSLLERWRRGGSRWRVGRGATGWEETVGEGAVKLLADVEGCGGGRFYGGDGFFMGLEGGVHLADGGAQQGDVRRVIGKIFKGWCRGIEQEHSAETAARRIEAAKEAEHLVAMLKVG